MFRPCVLGILKGKFVNISIDTKKIKPPNFGIKHNVKSTTIGIEKNWKEDKDRKKKQQPKDIENKTATEWNHQEEGQRH